MDDYLDVLVNAAKERECDRTWIIRKIGELKLDVFETKTLLIDAIIRLAEEKK